MSAPHLSVLLNEVVSAIAPAPGRHVVDGTFGAGGYARAFLAAGARVTAFDRDPSAARYAEELGPDFRLVIAPFSTMAEVLGEAAADGVALDLGVSSMQLDEAERGFSFLREGPLDMRMSGAGPTAADLVNTEPPAELARIFWIYGEERQSRRIASAIVRRRERRPSPARRTLRRSSSGLSGGAGAPASTPPRAPSRRSGSPSMMSWPSWRRASSPPSGSFGPEAGLRW